MCKLFPILVQGGWFVSPFLQVKKIASYTWHVIHFTKIYLFNQIIKSNTVCREHSRDKFSMFFCLIYGFSKPLKCLMGHRNIRYVFEKTSLMFKEIIHVLTKNLNCYAFPLPVVNNIIEFWFVFFCCLKNLEEV